MNENLFSQIQPSKDEIIRKLQDEVKSLTTEKELLCRHISHKINESKDVHISLSRHEEEMQLSSIKRERNFNQTEDSENENPRIKSSRKDYYVDVLTKSKRNLQQQLTIAEEKIDSLETELLTKSKELTQIQRYSCEIRKAKQEEYQLFENKLLEKNAKIDELNSLVNAQTITIRTIKQSTLNLQETLMRELIQEKEKNLTLIQHIDFLESRPDRVDKATQMPEFPLGAQLRNPFLPPRK